MKKILSILCIVVLTNLFVDQLYAQTSSSLTVENTHINGCDFYVIPLVAYPYTCSPQVLNSGRTLLTFGNSVNFTSALLPSSQEYVGFVTEGANGLLWAYCNVDAWDVTGDCTGLDVAVYMMFTGYGKID